MISLSHYCHPRASGASVEYSPVMKGKEVEVKGSTRGFWMGTPAKRIDEAEARGGGGGRTIDERSC
jgi:hypothetical protein